MKTIFCLFAALYLVTAAHSVQAQNLLLDSFESKNLSSPSGGGSWGASTATSVSVEKSRTGTQSLRFQYDGSTNQSADAWSEQRANIATSGEIYGRMYVYIPSNYYHRSVSPGNNKFWAIYASPYRTPGFQVNLSLNPGSSGNSNLALHTYHNGREAKILYPYSNFITASDRGQWMEVAVRVKVPTSSTSGDGIIQVWKNGTQVANYTNLNMFGSNGRNYINEMYLLGWSNSGFDSTTVFYIDDVEIADTPLGAIAPPPPPLVGVAQPKNLRITN